MPKRKMKLSQLIAGYTTAIQVRTLPDSVGSDAFSQPVMPADITRTSR